MKTLRETLQNQLESPVASPALGQTETATNLVRARTGRASTDMSGPRRSEQQERQAATNIKALGQQQQQQGQIASSAFAQAAEATDIKEQEQLKNISQEVKAIDQDFNLRATSILNNLARQKEQLDTVEYQNALEQVGFFTRLANQKYVQDLTIEAQKNRLNEGVNLKLALAQSAWADEQALLGNQIRFNELQNASQREFNEAMKIMDANVALQLAEADIDAWKAQQIWSGVSKGVSAGASIFADMDSATPKGPGTKDTTNVFAAESNMNTPLGQYMGGNT